MDLRPLYRRSFVVTTLRRGRFKWRAVFAVLEGALALTVYYICEEVQPVGPETAVLVADRRAAYAMGGGLGIVALTSVAMMLLVMSRASISIAEEREKGTLDSLLLTDMSPTEIVLAKLLGCFSAEASLWLISAPFLVFAMALANLPGWVWALTIAGALSTAFTMATIAMSASARLDKAQQASAAAGFGAMAWFLAPIFVQWLRPLTAFGLGPGAEAIVDLCDLLSRGSPVSLAFVASKLSASSSELYIRLAELFALQAAFSAYKLNQAVTALLPVATHPVQVATPPPPISTVEVGDDPILWREYSRMARRNRSNWIYGLAKALFVLLKNMTVNLVAVIVMAVGAAIIAISLLLPFALVWYLVRTTWLAGLEYYQSGFTHAGPAAARDAMNVVIRYAWGILGFGSLGAASGLGMGICMERDKGTWIILLTTPLEGAEIINSKLKAAVLRIRTLAIMAMVVCALGLAVGALDPLCLAVAAVMGAAAYASGVIGALWSALKPDREVQAARNAVNTSSMIWVIPNVLLGVAWLCSRPQINRLPAPAFAWGCAAAVSLLLAGLSLAIAYRRYHRLLERFDLWQGRPERSTQRVEPPRAHAELAAAVQA